MATTRLWSICSRLDLVVKYVGNKEKTTTKLTENEFVDLIKSIIQ